MPRAFQIFGPAIVQATFSPAVPLAAGVVEGTLNVRDLGLTSEAITITPNFHHVDVHTDNFGGKVPADTLCYLADCQIKMKLVHYDDNVLGYYLRESLAGGGAAFGAATLAGTMPSAGTQMGGGWPLYASGNHYVGLTIHSINAQQSDWIFPATYLTGPPMVHPVGTERSITECTIRAIPYAPITGFFAPGTTITTDTSVAGGAASIGSDAISSGAELWNYAGRRFP